MPLDPHDVPRLNVNDASAFEPFPEMGGAKGVLYHSPDGMRLAGSFKESGTHTMEMPFDEFIYVVAGGVSITVHGGDRHDFDVGDAFYLRQGMTVDFAMTDDFQDVTVLIADTPFDRP